VSRDNMSHMNRSYSLLALFSRERTLAPFFRSHTLTLSCSLALSLSHSSLSRSLALLLSRSLAPALLSFPLTLSRSLALSLSRSLALSLSHARLLSTAACFLFPAHTETTGWTLAWGSTLPDAKFKSMRPQVLCCSVLQCVAVCVTVVAVVANGRGATRKFEFSSVDLSFYM